MMMCDAFGFDTNEKATIQMDREENRIAKHRQLGDWITISVDGERETIIYNCKKCNRTGKCH